MVIWSRRWHEEDTRQNDWRKTRENFGEDTRAQKSRRKTEAKIKEATVPET